MTFINNKYLKLYNNIITKAKIRKTNSGYIEKHHIIPISLGGNNDMTNIVKLTGREHFICHRLLIKFTEGNDQCKMIFALNSMMNRYNDTMKRYVPNSRVYEYLRIKLSEAHKKIGRSPDHIAAIRKAHTGKYVSPETRKKMSDSIRAAGPAGGAIKGSFRSEETRQKISVARLGMEFTLEHRKHLSEARQNIKVAPETGQKISASLKGKAKKKITCPHCGLVGGNSLMKRWHFDKCKVRGTNAPLTL